MDKLAILTDSGRRAGFVVWGYGCMFSRTVHATTDQHRAKCGMCGTKISERAVFSPMTQPHRFPRTDDGALVMPTSRGQMYELGLNPNAPIRGDNSGAGVWMLDGHDVPESHVLEAAKQIHSHGMREVSVSMLAKAAKAVQR